MSSSLRRGTLAATALGIAAASLTACGAGSDAQTLQVKPDSAATAVGHVKLQNITLVTVPGRQGIASVTGRIFNNGTKSETLDSISVKGAGTSVKLHPAKGKRKLTVPADGSLALGGKDNAYALLTGASDQAVRNGNAQPVTFHLSRTGSVQLHATVVPAQGDEKKIGPSVQPAPGDSGSSTNSPSQGASDKGAGSPSDSASSEQGGGPAKSSDGAGKSAQDGKGAQGGDHASDESASSGSSGKAH